MKWHCKRYEIFALVSLISKNRVAYSQLLKLPLYIHDNWHSSTECSEARVGYKENIQPLPLCKLDHQELISETKYKALAIVAIL